MLRDVLNDHAVEAHLVWTKQAVSKLLAKIKSFVEDKNEVLTGFRVSPLCASRGNRDVWFGVCFILKTVDICLQAGYREKPERGPSYTGVSM